MNELALVAIRALPRGLIMPFFAKLCLVILVALWLLVQLVYSVSISALVIKLAFTCFHERFTKLSFVIKSEVFNILYHSLSRGETHLLFGSILSHVQFIIWEHRALDLTEIHQIEVRVPEVCSIHILFRLWFIISLRLIQGLENLVDMVELSIFDDFLCDVVLFFLTQRGSHVVEIWALTRKVKPSF